MIKFQEHYFCLVEDFSPDLMKKRLLFKPLMAECYEKNLKPVLLYPAKLRISPPNVPHQVFLSISETQGDPSILASQDSSSNDNFSILWEEVEAAIRSLKNGKAAEIINVSAEWIKHGRETMIDILTNICNKFWQTGGWSTSLTITLPKKGNLQQCQNYRTRSLISHASKVILKAILNRLKLQQQYIPTLILNTLWRPTWQKLSLPPTYDAAFKELRICISRFMYSLLFLSILPFTA
ncbi:uncharacterized protein LOC132381556 [Hypanus sabinus]|uniref:uncharacterized protein LOC132381556 n=1 Tax=Hypanus sabinus TaxID=79690 RepID=UPI0028C47A11|nr:uncharacterized protein LOC132381556 [Hypanus sabinus]